MPIVNERLAELGIELPGSPPPAANYVPFVISNQQVFVSGQVPFRDGALAYRGKVGDKYSLEEAQEAARLVGLNIISVVNQACGGDLDRVIRCVKLGGFVNCTPDFVDQPKVINGASDLMVEVFGDCGRHARFAVGTNVLPFDVPVEIDAIFEID
ncbi:MAG: RidA family protein [Acidobacteria bacterium]|nr:MAG: RidA family protein [Acidobacteriota bacterium]REK11049.1 MAG: RidA family protein [Acidobacteriota bacterium]